MQQKVFRNMDGVTYHDFLRAFNDMIDAEQYMCGPHFVRDSYRWVIGEHVYYIFKDAVLKHFGLDEAEHIIESGELLGIEFTVSCSLHPNTVQLERMVEDPHPLYISTDSVGHGGMLYSDMMKKALFPKAEVLNSLYGCNKEVVMNYRIKDVIFSGPCTIVLWKDGTKTIVRCENEFFDKEKGLAMAICKKVLGTNKSGSNYYDVFKKWCVEEDGFGKHMNLPEEPVVFTIEQVANKTGLSKTTINRRCLYKDYPNAKKINNVWWIPEADFQKDIKEGK